MFTNGETVGEERTMAATQMMARSIPEVELRDLFAMVALNGLVSAATILTPERHAQQAYEYADAMLEARKTK